MNHNTAPKRPPKGQTYAFVTATLGPVRHPSNLLLEFIEIWPRRNKVKALILSWFDSWHISKGETGWICASYRQIASAYGYCRDTVWRHLKDLVRDGYLICRDLLPQERSYPTDTRKMYQLNFEKLRQTLAAETQASTCQKSDTYLSENQTLDAKSQTQLNSLLNQPETTLTPPEPETVQEPCDCEEKFEIQNEEETRKTELLPDPELEESNLAEFLPDPKPGDTDLAKSLPDPAPNPEGKRQHPDLPKNSGKEEYSAQLVTKLNEQVNPPLAPIRFGAVRWVIEQFPDNLEGAVAAVMHGLQDGWVKNPTGYLIKALKEGIQIEPHAADMMGRTQWWQWIGEQWGRDKRNQLIQRVSDIGEGLRVYFTNGTDYPFEDIQHMTLVKLETLAQPQEPPQPELPQEERNISPEQIQLLRAMMRAIGGGIDA